MEVAGRHFGAALGLVPPSAPPTADMMRVYERFHEAGQQTLLHAAG